MSYNGSRDSIDYRTARKLEEELEVQDEHKASAVYQVIQDVRNSEDEIRKLTDQITRRMTEVTDALTYGHRIHEPYAERDGVDLKMAIAKRQAGYDMLVTLLGNDKLEELLGETKKRYEEQ